MLLRHLLLIRKRRQKIPEPINRRRQHRRKTFKIRPIGRARMTSRRRDHLGAFEALSQRL